MEMTRKQFLMAVAGALGAGFVVACGGGDEEPDAPCTSGTSVTFTNQHGHSITVSKADIDAGVDKTYTTSGTADHQHMVTITGAQLTSLLTGAQITTTTSTVLAHSHTVRVNCV